MFTSLKKNNGALGQSGLNHFFSDQNVTDSVMDKTDVIVCIETARKSLSDRKTGAWKARFYSNKTEPNKGREQGSNTCCFILVFECPEADLSWKTTTKKQRHDVDPCLPAQLRGEEGRQPEQDRQHAVRHQLHLRRVEAHLWVCIDHGLPFSSGMKILSLLAYHSEWPIMQMIS